MNVTAPIRRLARMVPDRLAIGDMAGNSLSYAMLEHAIDCMALQAMRLGLRAGDIVGMAPSPQEHVTGLVLSLALARIGVARAPLGLPADCVAMSLYQGAVAPPGTVRFDSSWLSSALAQPPGHSVPMHDDPDTLFCILSSSGTTGMRKNIPVSHGLMTRRVYGRWLSQGGGPRVRMIAVGLYISPGITSVLATLWQGGTVVTFDPDTALTAIDRLEVDSLVVSTGGLLTILDRLPHDATPPRSLREVEVGGSRVPTPLRRTVETRLCANIVSALGASESARIAWGPLAALDARPEAVGFIAPNVTVQAVDETNQPLPPGSEGILRLRSDMVAPGYFRDPAATDAQFRDGWFYPGDIGTVWPDGMLSLTGRTTERIEIGGNKFDLAAIEQALTRVPGVTDAAVFPVRTETGLNQIGAALVVSQPVDEDMLATFCQQNLPHVSFAVVLELEALPRNENGKVQRERLTDAVAELDRDEAEQPG